MKSFIKHIIWIILTGVVFYLLDRFADVRTDISAIRFTYAYPFLSCIAVICGAFTAGCAGIIGLLFPFVFEHAVFQWIDLACIFLFCLLIGAITANRLDYKDGILGLGDINILFRTQIIVNTAVWFIIRPLLYHYVLNVRMLEALREGFPLTLSRSLSGLLIGTVLMGIYSRARYSEACFYRS